MSKKDDNKNTKALEEQNDNEKIKELEAQIELLMKSVVGKSSNSSSVDSYIEFESVSLTPVYLSTEGNGNGELYTFTNFGEIQNIPIVDAREIVRHNKSFINEGVVYIKDEDFVAKENLNKHYDSIIDASSMQNLLLCKRETFSQRYSKLTDTQKSTVRTMLFNKVKDGKAVDGEVLYYIYQVSGINIEDEVSHFQQLIENRED